MLYVAADVSALLLLWCSHAHQTIADEERNGMRSFVSKAKKRVSSKNEKENTIHVRALVLCWTWANGKTKTDCLDMPDEMDILTIQAISVTTHARRTSLGSEK